jgi:hypothetical protein
VQSVFNTFFKVFQSLSGYCGYRYYRSPFEAGRLQQVVDFHTYQGNLVGIGQVGLGYHRNQCGHFHQVEYGQMFAGLRFDGFIGGYYQHHQVHAADARQHIF